MPLFEIVFQGQVKDGIAPAQARARLGQLFQAGDQQLDTLFSGRRIVIKQGLDAAGAERYRQAIERAGAVCSVEPMVEAMASAEAEPEQPVAPAQQAPRAASSIMPRDEYMAAFANVEAPDFGIAELGADLQDEYTDHTPLPLDLSALSLAPPGADLDQLKQDRPPVNPNIDHLKLVD
ncbi:hypothetical protein KEM63_12670 [Halopseudomonas nanhaiensis]|uniref:hypothetical protein n=1 Tax=Halopseudomonas nanhaiensis TaxID=2830842 RepID=UPI001CBB2F48|nr:hypothetical protein [Halopseudomonas nanhaiensis]UAW97647.1 hypothetical protein KEM63_12670 [Halopseudomonas nanhaiensis]